MRRPTALSIVSHKWGNGSGEFSSLVLVYVYVTIDPGYVNGVDEYIFRIGPFLFSLHSDQLTASGS
jgi:hypothetical protein